MTPTIDPTSIHTATLRDRISNLKRAWRHPLAPGCAPGEDRPQLPDPPPPPSGGALRSTLLFAPISVAAAGDSILIPIVQGRKLIYEMFLWNVAAQTLQLWQGNNIRLLQLTGFPALSGFMLGFNGNFDQPHFDIDPNQPFILNCSVGTQVDGFIRYRIPSSAY